MSFNPKQYRIRYIGGLKNVFSRAQFYLSLINFFQVSVVTYAIVVKGFAAWMTWYEYLALLGGVVIVAMVFEYKIMLPSEMAFSNWQWWTHGNPLKPAIEDLQKEIRELREELHKGKPQ